MVLIGVGDREVDEEKPGSVLAAASRTVVVRWGRGGVGKVGGGVRSEDSSLALRRRGRRVRGRGQAGLESTNISLTSYFILST